MEDVAHIYETTAVQWHSWDSYRDSVALHEPGFLLTSQGGARGMTWVCREALPDPHGAGHSDTALSSREGGKAPHAELCPHSPLWKNNKAILRCFTHTPVMCAPGGWEKSTLGSCLGKTKMEVKALGRLWLWGRKGELRVK